jgi:hypothetical protein
MWTAVEDGYVITKKTTDEEIWVYCQAFGSLSIIEAIENFLGQIGLPLETEEVPVILDREP